MGYPFNLGIFPIINKRLYLKVKIGVACDNSTATTAAQHKTVKGLVDTGATSTVISSQLAETLALMNTGGRNTVRVGSGEIIETREHFADIIIIGQHYKQLISCLQINSIENLPEELIIGMDIISNWVMLWDGSSNQVQITVVK